MKRSMRAITLVAILLVISVATFALTRYEEKKEQIKNSDEIILEIPKDKVESLSWEFEDDSLAFHKDDETWVYDKDEAFPVSGEKVNDILSNFEAFGVSFIIENVEDYGQYGLDKPECTIHLTTTDSSYQIKLGNFSKMDEQRYLDIGDGNVYLVSKDPMDYLETELSGMILHDELPDFESIKDIQFTGKENYSIFYVEDSKDSYSQDDVYFTEKNGKNLPLDTETVKDYLDTITSLKLKDYVTYNATDEDLESYGLNNPELSISINYTYTDEEDNELSDSLILHISQDPKELKATKEAQAKAEDTKKDKESQESDNEEAKDEEDVPAVTKYLRVGDSQIIYKLDDSDYDILAAASYNDLRHKEVIWADFDMVKQIDITLEGKNHTINSSLDGDDDDAEPIWYYNDKEIDISNFKSGIESLVADSFTDETPSQKEEISLVVHLENENFPQVEIRLYRYDGSYCLAVVDGQSISLVERSAVMDLVEAVQAIVLN